MPIVGLKREGSDCQACYEAEVREGLLTCAACHAAFPVVDFIPRMLPDALTNLAGFLEKYRSRVNRYAAAFTGKEQLEGVKKEEKSFGYEWLKGGLCFTDEA
jgi:uncharacterized protein YbaR (Trm112 family)